MLVCGKHNTRSHPIPSSNHRTFAEKKFFSNSAEKGSTMNARGARRLCLWQHILRMSPPVGQCCLISCALQSPKNPPETTPLPAPHCLMGGNKNTQQKLKAAAHKTFNHTLHNLLKMQACSYPSSNFPSATFFHPCFQHPLLCWELWDQLAN